MAAGVSGGSSGGGGGEVEPKTSCSFNSEVGGGGRHAGSPFFPFFPFHFVLLFRIVVIAAPLTRFFIII